MGTSGNPAKRAMEGNTGLAGRSRRVLRRDIIDVDIDKPRRLVLLDVGGQVTGMTVETTDALIESLSNARKAVVDDTDNRPHSRACGARLHDHGSGCHSNCPTCHGNPLEAAQAL